MAVQRLTHTKFNSHGVSPASNRSEIPSTLYLHPSPCPTQQSQRSWYKDLPGVIIICKYLLFCCLFPFTVNFTLNNTFLTYKPSLNISFSSLFSYSLPLYFLSCILCYSLWSKCEPKTAVIIVEMSNAWATLQEKLKYLMLASRDYKIFYQASFPPLKSFFVVVVVIN